MVNIEDLIKINNMRKVKINQDERILVNYAIKFLELVNYHILFKRFIAFFLYKIGIQSGVISLVCKYTPGETKEIRRINKQYESGNPYLILPGQSSGRKKKVTPEIHTKIIKLILEHRVLSTRKLALLLKERHNVALSYKVIEKEIKFYGLEQILS